MKENPNTHPKIVLVLGLLAISAILIVINRANAQGSPPIPVVVGELPVEPPGLFPPLPKPEYPQITAAAALTKTIYLPLVTRPTPCNLNSQEQELANLITQHPDQGRPIMNCHPILAQVARERALDMGIRNYFSHTNPDGYGPNYLVRQAGYTLPPWNDDTNDANNIESIFAGYPTAALVFAGWLNSAGHRVHILGENSFWAEQTNYGIGYAYVPGSTYGHYWVFISAPPEE